MKKNLINLLAICLILFASCKKDKTEKTSPLVGTWTKTKMETKTSSTNWTVDTRTCYTDDLEEYGADGSWTLYDGTKQCSAGSGITKGNWRLAANNTKIIFTYQAFSGEYESTVETLSETSLVLTQSVGDLANTEVRITYVKK